MVIFVINTLIKHEVWLNIKYWQ